MSNNKILVSDSSFLECVDELATQITEMNFGEDTYTENKIFEGKYETVMTEDAQDYYNEKFDNYEDLINKYLNVWNIQKQTN
jgi:hypothetical protein